MLAMGFSVSEQKTFQAKFLSLGDVQDWYPVLLSILLSSQNM